MIFVAVYNQVILVAPALPASTTESVAWLVLIEELSIVATVFVYLGSHRMRYFERQCQT